MKKFKKGETKVKGGNKDKEDISAFCYFICGEDNNEGKQQTCNLLASSWDGRVRFFDDSDSNEEGLQKQP